MLFGSSRCIRFAGLRFAAAIVDDPKNRFKNLAKGEVCVGNYLTGANVVFRANGDIEIVGDNDIKITVPDANEVNITIDTMVCKIDSAGIDITNGDVVADGISLKTHVHSGVQSGGSNTGAPV